MLTRRKLFGHFANNGDDSNAQIFYFLLATHAETEKMEAKMNQSPFFK